MNIGSLRHRITLERYVQGQDEIGQPIAEWIPVGTVSASIEPLSGREFIAAQAAQSEVTTRIRLRYLAGIDSTARVIHGEQIYNVLSVIDPAMRHVTLELLCKSN